MNSIWESFWITSIRCPTKTMQPKLTFFVSQGYEGPLKLEKIKINSNEYIFSRTNLAVLFMEHNYWLCDGFKLFSYFSSHLKFLSGNISS